MKPALSHALSAGLLIVWPAFVTSALSAPSKTLEGEIERQVEVIKSAMEGAGDIDLREFQGLSTDELNGQIGAGIREAFVASLRTVGVVLNTKADHVLNGEYLVTDRTSLQNGEPLRLTIKIGLTRRSGEAPVELLPIRTTVERPEHFARVDSTKDLAKAFGTTAGLTPDSHGMQISKEQRQREMREQILKPSAKIFGTRLRSSPTSAYEVEIYAKPLYGGRSIHPCRLRWERDVAYVDLNKDDVYEIRLYNRSNAQVAAAVCVDGLDVFHFADKEYYDGHGKCLFTHFVLSPKGGTIEVPGWFQRLKEPGNANYLSFLVTEYGKGAVSQAGITARGQVGAIHIQFSHCYQLPPGVNAKGGNETGFGPPVSVQQKAVKLEIEPPHDFVTIRYTRPQ
jgi:hypothetical protein